VSWATRRDRNPLTTVISASLIAWELRDGSYVEVAHVTAAEPYEATVPFAVTVVPRDLVAERPVP